MATKQRLAQALCVVAILSGPFNGFSDDSAIQRELDLIKEQNRVLQEQVKTLTGKVAALEDKDNASERPANYSGSKTNQTTYPKIKLGLSGGLGWLWSNGDGNGDFFIDDVKLSLDAGLTRNISFYSDINLHYPQSAVGYGGYTGNTIELNEIYLDFHNLLERWGRGSLLNVRAGQIYIPFGEDYELRYPFENPLIQHSLSDIWGLAPGLELYGAAGKWNWAIAVQNRSPYHTGINTGDKSVSGRIRFTPCDRFSVSASAMRTGGLESRESSYVYFNDYNFYGAPSPFYYYDGLNYTYYEIHGDNHAELFELAPRVNWKTGYLRAAGGLVLNNANWETVPAFRSGHYTQHTWYYNCELVQDILPNFYAAGRAGQIFYDETAHQLRVSIGLGYRFNKYVLAKTDYTYEQGSFGAPFPNYYRDTVGAELAFRF